MAPERRSITVLVDGSEVEVPRGSTLGTVLSSAKTEHRPGSIVAVGMPREAGRSAPTRFVLATSGGEIVFDLLERKRLADLALRLGKTELAVQYEDANELSLGKFRIDGTPVYGERQLDEGDVFLDMAGMDRDATCLILTKRRHRGSYSAVLGGKIGRVVAGQSVLKALTIKHKVTAIRPWTGPSADRASAFKKTSDLGTRITKEGTMVCSTVAARLLDGTPETADMLMHSLRDGTMRIDGSSGTFISTNALAGLRVSESNSMPRAKGAITVRNDGSGQGRMYFFKRPRLEATSHTVVGRVERGAALLDLAEEGDLVSIKLEPRRISVVGMSQADAEERLSSLRIRHVRKGCVDDDAIVVRQSPRYTMEITRTGSVETLGLRPDRIVRMRLLRKEAPESVRYLLAATGLSLDPIGSFSILYPYISTVGAVLMRGDAGRTVRHSIPPENTPSVVRRGDVGITNSIKGRMGSIGVRIDESEDYGPTCESLEGTNIVGKIKEDSLRLLVAAKEGEVVFIQGVE